MQAEINEKLESINGEKKIFLSYSHKDADIADLIQKKLEILLDEKAVISRDVRDVKFHQSFYQFMQSIQEHDFVIMVVSDHYLKSRNCMYEVLEAVKNKDYKKKIICIILGDEDVKYYTNPTESSIGVDLYHVKEEAKYIKYWGKEMQELQKKIDEIADPMYGINLISEKKIVNKIMLDIPEFFDYVRTLKGLTLSEHIENGFSEMLEFMGFALGE